MNRRSVSTGIEGLQVRIRVEGQLDGGWSSWFDGLAVTQLSGGETCLHGSVPDQSSLHGLLARIRDLGIPLVGLEVTGAVEGSVSDRASPGQPDRSELLDEPRPDVRPT